MFLDSLPDHLIFLILKLIPDNKTSISLVSTCKYFKHILYKHGYLKQLTCKPLGLNPYDFSIKCSEHYRSLNMVSMYYINDAHLWICYWPRIVFFNYCRTGKINPPKVTETEVLYILNDKSKDVDVNWDKFPKLKRLEISNCNFNLKNIKDKCKYLNCVNIRN
jgi:hypothetical protein